MHSNDLLSQLYYNLTVVGIVASEQVPSTYVVEWTVYMYLI